MVQPTPAATLENLSRLATKPGVQSTLILSKSDGSIIHSTGLLANSTSSSSPDPSNTGLPNQVVSEDSVNGTEAGSKYTGDVKSGNESKSAENVARMVFSFVSSAKAFTEGMDESDEVKLLRLRTRRNEIVIVPDLKFLLVVIHDAPGA